MDIKRWALQSQYVESTFDRYFVVLLPLIVKVESMDKAGNFIGYMWVDGTNLSVHLTQEGYASMHFTADRFVTIELLKVKSTADKMCW